MSLPGPSTLSGDTLASLAALGRRVGRPCSPVPRAPDRGPAADPTMAGPALSGSRRLVCPDAWAERAAILEYDGGLPRVEAERMALSLLLLERTDGPSTQADRLDRELTTLDTRRP